MVAERDDKGPAVRKSYVRRLFVVDDIDELIPERLNFVRDVSDSEEVPSNISRELLPRNKMLRVIEKSLAEKCLEIFGDRRRDCTLVTKMRS